MRDRETVVGGGGLTGATGDLTPDDTDRAFAAGERREVTDPEHHADVTDAQVRTAPAQQGDVGDDRELPDGGSTNLATRDDGYGSRHGLSPDDPAYRMDRKPPPAPADDEPPAVDQRPELGGDDLSRGEERF